uniref:Uncharacterized protein n=1 Tax=Chelonoidis abingdonii TaxID=106734 RepID=A0A8C0GMG7_CHEAB
MLSSIASFIYLFLPYSALTDLKQNRISQRGGSNDHVENSADSATKHCMELGSRTYSTSAIHLTASSSTPTSRHQSKPKGVLCKLVFSVFTARPTPISKLNSLESSRNASSSSSPVNLKGKILSDSRDDLLSDYFRKANEPPPVGNQLSQPSRKETAKAPTSYVSPTIKMTIASEEGRVAKPGHYVKPNLRPAESEALATGSLKLPPTPPHQPLSGLRPMAQPQQTSTMSQRNASLSRAFSLASADLLRATGPETYRQESPQKLGADVRTGKDSGSQTLRLSVPPGSHATIRDRPQSAKAACTLQTVDSRCRQLDVRRLSLAPPKEERPLSFHQSSASASANSVQQPEQVSAVPGQHYSPTRYIPAKVKSKPAACSGEVATVTPVRAASSNSEGDVTQGQSRSDALITKCQSRSPEGHAGAGGIEESNRGGSSKSTPGSPDPHGDQQTVWYEYGCV